ncbi:MAG: ABC transporter permease [Bacteroidales bacterium]|nr:ABC transporter permease [Bacteroidales bacterium]
MINIISGICVAGMAIGTAALIIILSVFNGFNRLVSDSLSEVAPDILVSPTKGKVFVPKGEAFEWAYENDDVLNMSEVLEEQVFISYDGKQALAKAKGVDNVYEEESPLRNHIKDGEFILRFGDLKKAVVGMGLAYNLGISPRFLSPIEIYYPVRDAKVSLSNPMNSLSEVDVRPSGLFSINATLDNELIIVPIETMRELLHYENEVSAVEIRTADGASVQKVADGLKERLGPDFKVLNRYEQNENLFKMMRYEKLAIYMILIFIIIIIAFNIFASLTMLVIEKKDDISTLKSLGATDSLVRRIFVMEGWMISLLGLAIGLLIGVAFALLQQKFGFIKMPGNYVVTSYPIVLKLTDILWTVAGVAGVGYLIALLPTLKKTENQ